MKRKNDRIAWQSCVMQCGHLNGRTGSQKEESLWMKLKNWLVLEQENEELKRELKELFKTLDQMNQSLNRMIDHYILCKTEKAG